MINLPDKTFRSPKNQARVKLCLRFVVALYILYLTKGILTAAIQGTTTLPIWFAVLVSAVFIASSVLFCLYAWRQYKQTPSDTPQTDDKAGTEESTHEDS